MTHALKTWLRYYKPLVDGEKTFELRKDDRPFTVGDTLLAQEYDELKNTYTGNESYFIITYILRDAEFFGVKNGYCILGIKPKESSY